MIINPNIITVDGVKYEKRHVKAEQRTLRSYCSLCDLRFNHDACTILQEHCMECDYIVMLGFPVSFD